MPPARSPVHRRDPAGMRERLLADLLCGLRTQLHAIPQLLEPFEQRTDLPPDLAHAARAAATAAREVLELSARALRLAERTPAPGARAHPPAPRIELVTICRRAIEEIRADHPTREITLDARRPLVGPWNPHRSAQIIDSMVRAALAHTSGAVRVQADADATSAIVRVILEARQLSPAHFIPLLDVANECGGLLQYHANPEGDALTARFARAGFAYLGEAH